MADIVTKTFTPGFRLIDGDELNDAFDQVNGALDGTTTIVINATGAFNGTIGGTTPAAGDFTYINQGVDAGLTAAGTTRADALALTKAINVVGTAAASTGVVLPSAATVGIGGSVIVFNDGANAIKVYGAGSDTIDGVAGSTGVTLTNALRCEFYVTAAATFKSAKLGATST